MNLTEVSKERDDLAAALKESRTREKQLSDEVHRMSEKQATLEEELDAAKRQNKEDEDSITMLRTKVEESR